MFQCPWALETSEWVIMPFGLKNDGVTYQRIINFMFHDFIKTSMKVYMGDIVVKSSSKKGHLDHLRLSFERRKKYELKMNPLKYLVGIYVEEFLSFVVHKRAYK